MLISLLLCLIPAIVVYTLVRNYFLLPSSIPGPFFARFTDAYRALLVYRRNPHEVHLALHKKHGNLVRLGPNYVSVSGSRGYTPQIYGIGKGLVKSDFYSVFQNIVNGRRAASLVAETDETAHAKSKRLIAHAYSLSTLVEYESLVERTTLCFLDTLESRFAKSSASENETVSGNANDSPTCAASDNDHDKLTATTTTISPGRCLDLAQYLQFFAFDVIGELTFSRRLGFIESGTDVDGIIDAIGSNFSYFSVLGQMPWLDEAFLGKNPVYVKYFRKSVSSPILIFAQRLLKGRLQDLEKGGGGDQKNQDADNSFSRPDFLTRFLKVRKEQADGDEALTDGQILSYLFVGVPFIVSTSKAPAPSPFSVLFSPFFLISLTTNILLRWVSLVFSRRHVFSTPVPIHVLIFVSIYSKYRLTRPRPLTQNQMNINAGSDTIASTLRAIFYYLLKHPESLATLVHELDRAARDSKISVPCPTWAETQESLPYLCAVIKEGLRLNPALSLPLERVVPKTNANNANANANTTKNNVGIGGRGGEGEGLALLHEDGTRTFFPAGTIIGINPWVFHRSTHVFGDDAESWNPSRWLSDEEVATKSMEHSLLSFGAGKRSCLGKNIALLELHKLVPAMLLKFKIELAHPEWEWTVENAWALNQRDIEVTLSLR
ncbi:hypothetical protein PV08_06554 [Exophiala spinifera]|uniref:Cytochrome P450 oxidoreductase n=1 Tax=Exophiala spinifera TaxID=91928 RepID=A0A0D2BYY4_9EURO|nr:uncharacterized protein PV08_06554 [Exophiala spinifera]KIW16499.1 hypothetical protein PV08_06554 [Exophiala spinifera]